MRKHPATPLEPFSDGSVGGGPAIYLKREDLLPFGGGNKVRRLLAWIDELRTAPSANGAVAWSEAIAVLSYRGSHTFLSLVELLRASALPCKSLIFWETNRPATGYVEQIRGRYVDQPDITVVRGSTLGLLARMCWTKWLSRGKIAVLGIGGAVSPRGQPYRAALDECVWQLAEQGRGEARVWHLLPASSGTMLAGLVRAIREAGYQNHRLIGVLTGPQVARWMLWWKYRGRRDVLLVPPRSMDWRTYLAAARQFHLQTGVWLDPMHAIHVGKVLSRLPGQVKPQDVVVLWITCPRTEPLSDEPA